MLRGQRVEPRAQHRVRRRHRCIVGEALRQPLVQQAEGGDVAGLHAVHRQHLAVDLGGDLVRSRKVAGERLAEAHVHRALR